VSRESTLYLVNGRVQQLVRQRRNEGVKYLTLIWSEIQSRQSFCYLSLANFFRLRAQRNDQRRDLPFAPPCEKLRHRLRDDFLGGGNRLRCNGYRVSPLCAHAIGSGA